MVDVANDLRLWSGEVKQVSPGLGQGFFISSCYNIIFIFLLLLPWRFLLLSGTAVC